MFTMVYGFNDTAIFGVSTYVAAIERTEPWLVKYMWVCRRYNTSSYPTVARFDFATQGGDGLVVVVILLSATFQLSMVAASDQ